MKRRKLEHCVTTERPKTVLICPTKKKGKARKTKGGFSSASFASELASCSGRVQGEWGVSHMEAAGM